MAGQSGGGRREEYVNYKKKKKKDKGDGQRKSQFKFYVIDE